MKTWRWAQYKEGDRCSYSLQQLWTSLQMYELAPPPKIKTPLDLIVTFCLSVGRCSYFRSISGTETNKSIHPERLVSLLHVDTFIATLTIAASLFVCGFIFNRKMCSFKIFWSAIKISGNGFLRLILISLVTCSQIFVGWDHWTKKN